MTLQALRSLLSFALLMMFAAPALSAPHVIATASHTEDCVAPCAVLFDATGTDDPAYLNDFQTLHYEWNFDDERGEVWEVSGQNKNQAIGGLAGHVFTEPGTFQVALTVRNPARVARSVQLTVEVSDPDVVFAGQRTICVSPSGSFAGCPPGARRRTTGNFGGAFENENGHRTLLHRGESFSAGDVRLVNASATGSILGAYGSGAPPILRPSRGIQGNRGWRVMDLHIIGTGSTGSESGAFLGGPRDFTVFRVEVENWNRCIGWSSTRTVLRGNAVVEFRCSNFPNGGTASKIFENTRETIWMGMQLIGPRSAPGEHEFMYRAVYTNKEIIQHSYFDGSPANRNNIQLRGCSPRNDQWCTSLGTPSQYLIFSDNHIVEGRPKSGSVIKVTHATTGFAGNEGNPNLDFIFERNLIQLDDLSSSDTLQKIFELQATHATIRNNVLDLQRLPVGGGTNRIVDMRRSDTSGIDQGSVQILNNTVLLPNGFPNTFVIGTSRSLGANHVAMNNLIHTPGSVGPRIVTEGPNWTSAGNLFSGGSGSGRYQGNPFVGGLPGYLQTSLPTLDAFRLGQAGKISSGSDPVRGGYDFSQDASAVRTSAHIDAFGNCRVGEGGWDVGAHQRSAVPCAQQPAPLPIPPPAPTIISID